MHLKLVWLRWIENRLSPGERRQAEAHLADCPECSAELGELQELLESLEAIPPALSALPWRKERLWPAIRGRLQAPPPALGVGRWAGWVSVASLLLMFCGVWWGSTFNVVPAATVSASYVARPPTTLPWLATPSQNIATENGAFQLALPRGTPQPLPAPAQTPVVVEMVLTGTMAPDN